jgi:hypothetical protein
MGVGEMRAVPPQGALSVGKISFLSGQLGMSWMVMLSGLAHQRAKASSRPGHSARRTCIPSWLVKDL